MLDKVADIDALVPFAFNKFHISIPFCYLCILIYYLPWQLYQTSVIICSEQKGMRLFLHVIAVVKISAKKPPTANGKGLFRFLLFCCVMADQSFSASTVSFTLRMKSLSSLVRR